MNNIVLVKNYSEPPFELNDIYRYSGCKQTNLEISKLTQKCIDELSENISYNVCFRELSVEIKNEICDFGIFSISSEDLSKNLIDCKKVILFCASVGIGIDRMILKNSRICPSKAVIFDAIGTERIESLCDAFCLDMEKTMKLKARPRFSPGYGDLSIEVQKDIFRVLDCSKNIGVYLNDSLLMSPSKSVTAFLGLY